MSIRNTAPPFDPNIPVVTPGGGTASAYKDPNSPESLMKKATEMNVQAAVDSTYDVKEGFRRRLRGNRQFSFALFIILLLLLLQDRLVKTKASRIILWFVFALAILLLLRSVYLSE